MIVIKYNEVKKAIFLERPNRFIAKVLIDGNEEIVHVKNTGRCKELLVSGSTVYLSVSNNPKRKTKFDLIGVDKIIENGILKINIDSQIPNDVVCEWLKKGKLFSDKANIKREVFYNKSRFDFYIEDGNRKAFLEVKGVTLEENGIAMFPDAPTERGIKHINELIEAVNNGYEAYIFFVIQMNGVRLFTPNCRTHLEFCNALKKAYKNGVNILVYDSIVTNDSIDIDKKIEFNLT